MKYSEVIPESPAETATPSGRRACSLPVRSILRLNKASDIWHKPGFSAATALAVPQLVLLAVGRLDLVVYTSAGSMCALYAHNLPYVVRARTLVWVIVGMVVGFGVALTTASLTDSGPVLVLGAALIAAAHKMLCDATRIGPPSNLIFTFIAASGFFLPERLSEVPLHMALALARCRGGLAGLHGARPGAATRPGAHRHRAGPGGGGRAAALARR